MKGEQTVEIKRLSHQDLPSLLELYKHLNKTDDPLPPMGQVEEVWNQIVSSEMCLCFGGFMDGALVCSCVLSIIPNLSRGCRSYGVLENVVTHKEYRKRGYGRELMKKVMAYAWSKNCYKIMLLTGRRDEEIESFYKSVGFDPNAKRAFVAKPPNCCA